jgi:hypothetical protein
MRCAADHRVAFTFTDAMQLGNRMLKRSDFGLMARDTNFFARETRIAGA